jgi:hypothetical protein
LIDEKLRIDFKDDDTSIIGPAKTERNNYDVGILLNSCD